MFISNKILGWNYYSENGSGFWNEDEDNLVWRAHDLWRHAISLITTDCSEFACSDAIANLKRAVNHRLQALSRAYSFDALPFANKKQALEKLQFYGIIRPAMLKELFEVRNAIEHQDNSPPSSAHCKRYGDLVWYFLKSTDSLLLIKVDDVTFYSDDEQNSLTFLPKFDGSWSITVQGNISSEHILVRSQPDAFELDEACERPSYIPPPVYGKWSLTPEQLTDFARKYFGLSGYWWEDHA